MQGLEATNCEVDIERLRAADPEGLYLFMLEDYPYMMSVEQVAAFTGTTPQVIRHILIRGEMKCSRVGLKWVIPKLGLLEYLYRDLKTA